MSECSIIIPVRLESTRLPNKVLLDIAGQSMLQRVWAAACGAKVGPVYIATDNQKIADVTGQFGAEVLMSGQQDSGTSRIAEVIQQLALNDDDLVINLQGDEPLMPPEVLKALASFADSQSADAYSVYSRMLEPTRIGDPNCVKVVCDSDNNALYFSRNRVPAQRGDEAVEYRLHHGIYAYRVGLLKQWPTLKRGPLEQAESLEQLRLLEGGKSIAMLEAPEVIPAGVDTMEDLLRVREHCEPAGL